MNMKTLAAGFIGLVVGVLGYYLVGRPPVPNTLQPTNPQYVGQLFQYDVIANSLYSVKSLMFKPARGSLTGGDWNSLKRWVADSNGIGLDTYEVLTLPNHRTVTLWLTPVFSGPGGSSVRWEIQQIVEGTAAGHQSGLVFVQATKP